MSGVVRISAKTDFDALSRTLHRGSSGVVSVRFVPLGVSPATPRGTVRASNPENGNMVAVAYAVGTHIGNAVERNRFRRRLRAIVSQTSLRPGLYLVGARPGATATTFGKLTQQFAAACARAWSDAT